MSGTTAPANPSYVQRALNFTITLGEGTFGQTGFNTVKLSGLRSTASILKGGYPSMDTAIIRIYGVQPSIMNQVATLSVPQTLQRANNTVTVEAGDAVNGMAVIFSGNIYTAIKDFDGSPDTFLQIVCNSGAVAAMEPVQPISFPGGADVATIMAGLAIQMGMAFENNGVQVQLASPYFAGAALEQAHNVARAANIEMYVDSTGNPPTLAIWPKNKTRGGVIPLISPSSGLVGYPKYRDFYMGFRCIFNPSIRLGGQIKMQSASGGAVAPSTATPQQTQDAGPNGYWYVVSPLSYDLAAQLPDGPWFCDVTCARTSGLPGT